MVALRDPIQVSEPKEKKPKRGLPVRNRKSPEHMKDQPSSAGCRVHALSQALKADFAGGKAIHGFDEMLQ
jgi:hypothetical protein